MCSFKVKTFPTKWKLFLWSENFHDYFRNENSFAKDYDRDFDGVAGDEAAVKKFKEMEDAYMKQKRKK